MAQTKAEKAAYMRKWYAKNKDKVNAKKRTPEGREHANELRRKRFTNNPAMRQRVLDYNKSWRDKHREHRMAKKRAWYAEHKDEARQQQKEAVQKHRRKVLEHYSGKIPHCAYCGEDWYPCLEVDHINGDGWKQDKRTTTNGVRSRQSYVALINGQYPKDRQVLCGSCNRVKGKMTDTEFRQAYPERIKI